jgi:hypothetical protein
MLRDKVERVLDIDRALALDTEAAVTIQRGNLPTAPPTSDSFLPQILLGAAALPRCPLRTKAMAYRDQTASWCKTLRPQRVKNTVVGERVAVTSPGSFSGRFPGRS